MDNTLWGKIVIGWPADGDVRTEIGWLLLWAVYTCCQSSLSSLLLLFLSLVLRFLILYPLSPTVPQTFFCFLPAFLSHPLSLRLIFLSSFQSLPQSQFLVYSLCLYICVHFLSTTLSCLFLPSFIYLTHIFPSWDLSRRGNAIWWWDIIWSRI